MMIRRFPYHAKGVVYVQNIHPLSLLAISVPGTWNRFLIPLRQDNLYLGPILKENKPLKYF